MTQRHISWMDSGWEGAGVETRRPGRTLLSNSYKRRPLAKLVALESEVGQSPEVSRVWSHP